MRMLNFSRFLPLGLLSLFLLALVGCKTTEASNDSARPWNSPRGWETGAIPAGINEGR